MSDRWVCLMYHDIVPRQSHVDPDSYFSVPVGSFEEQLDFIERSGLLGCSLEHAIAERGSRIAITFDDGNSGQYERGFRVLVSKGMSATFFVTTGWVGRPGYVSWDQLREMKAEGMSVQSHTESHPFLSELSGDALRRELWGSKERLDHELEQDTETLALPGGDFPRWSDRGALPDAGYQVVATSRWGTNRSARESGLVTLVRRCTLRGSPTRPDFDRIMRGDKGLARRRRSRELVLGGLRRSLGPSRYARWRRALLDRIG